MATLALWSAAWVLIGQQLRRSDAFAKVVSAKSGPIALARVPGGVARRVTTSPAMMIQEVVWSSDSRYVLYTATPELSLGKIMRVSSASGNPFDVSGNNERMQREMLQMMAPQVRYCDLRTRDSGQIVGTWPPHLHPLGDLSVSPDGRYLALTLADYSQINSVEEQFEAQREVYVVPLRKDFRLGEPRHIGQATQFHWLPDSRRLLYLRDSGPQAGTYVASVDGGKARLLDTEHTEYRLRGIAADQTVAYCTFSRKGRNLLGQGWALRHLDLRSGRFRDVPLRNGPSQLRPLRRGEAPFVHRPDGDEGPTQIAAVDFATGQVRWLRRDLKGRFWGAERLLGGRALLLATSSASETGDTQTQFAVLSLQDGKVRLFPPLRLPGHAPEKWWVSPDGLAVALQSSGMKMTGLDPFSMLRETLWVAKLTDARALLSGQGQ
ncbi:MAG: hypothetical protein HPY69_12280 [Armatimonadetes bacterium]|nr:hypothetical protein [Armatimonadota bacterium]